MAKATKKQALGRGLSALLKDPENDIRSVTDKNASMLVGNIVALDIDSIEVNPFQPRSNFNEESLEELAGSIRELGVIQPITVRKIDFNQFQLVSGERRFRASKLVGLKTIPAYIRIANDQESLEMALVENIQRQDLDPIEIALSYQRLLEEIQLTQEKMSERVGKKRSTVTNYMRLLKLDPIVQTGIRDGFLSMGHGRALVNISDTKDQIKLYELIVKNHLSVRDTEEAVRKYQQPGVQSIPKSESKIPSFVKADTTEFQKKFQVKIAIAASAKGAGKISLHFKDLAEYEALKKTLLGD
ncbi:ParB/RepB/Spo0J family partition protein [bacterium]|nr:ParB/RepB/Spo0J family partition protein [bacterium]MDB4495354.1 ParB/RepB/Spo0J family partition protein [Flavobacteriaceae bacterium]